MSMAAAARRAGALWQPGKGTKLFIKIPAHLERSDLSTRLGGVLEKHHGEVKVYFHLMGSRRTILTDPRYWVETEDSPAAGAGSHAGAGLCRVEVRLCRIDINNIKYLQIIILN